MRAPLLGLAKSIYYSRFRIYMMLLKLVILIVRSMSTINLLIAKLITMLSEVKDLGQVV